MTLIRRPSPFREMVALRSTLDRLFDESLLPTRSLFASSDELGLPFDIRVTPEAVEVEAALPGARPEDVEITVTGSTLTIATNTESRREEKDGDYLLREIRRGSFTRSVALPSGLEPDLATASFDNGLLALRIPKAETVKPKQIRITAASHDQSTVIPGKAVESEAPRG